MNDRCVPKIGFGAFFFATKKRNDYKSAQTQKKIRNEHKKAKHYKFQINIFGRAKMKSKNFKTVRIVDEF